MKIDKPTICLVEFTFSFPRPSSLTAYNEVVETYFWGFHALGFDVERRGNQAMPGALNLVFGFHIPLQLGLIDSFPANTIILNFERMTEKGYDIEANRIIGEKFQIWEYSEANMPVWNSLGTKFPVYLARISYAPILEKIPKNNYQDIDILFYGSVSHQRLTVIHEITRMRQDLSSVSFVVLMGIYGSQRDEFISRSKLVLNISTDVNFEIVRISYLLANCRPVICVSTNKSLKFDEDLHGNGLKILDAVLAREECERLLLDSEARLNYADTCYQAFKSRDVRLVIAEYFESFNFV